MSAAVLLLLLRLQAGTTQDYSSCRGAQRCTENGRWYCCDEPSCNLQRGCGSNRGLFFCGCPGNVRSAAISLRARLLEATNRSSCYSYPPEVLTSFQGIPRLIWQTAISPKAVPEEALFLMDSWGEKNGPTWHHRVCYDRDVDLLFSHPALPPRLREAYKMLPVGVMKADVWRYAVLYVHGGVYADLDAECKSPVHEWLNNSSQDPVGLIVGAENGVNLCQWTMASRPRHPAVRTVLELVATRVLDEGIDLAETHVVCRTTGPCVWNSGIRQHLRDTSAASLSKLGQLERWMRLQDDTASSTATLLLATRGSSAAGGSQASAGEQDSIQFLPSSALHHRLVHHHYGSQRWFHNKDYHSWTAEEAKLRSKLHLAHGTPAAGSGQRHSQATHAHGHRPKSANGATDPRHRTPSGSRLPGR